MRKALLFPVLLSVLALSSCTGIKGPHHEVQEYMSTMSFKTDSSLKVLQLSDLHLSSQRNLDVDYAFMKKVYNQAGMTNDDLLVITGDLFTFATKETIEKTFEFFNSLGCKWTYTFGNHDEQIYAEYTYAAEAGAKYSNCLFHYLHDDMNGLSNSIINVKAHDSDDIKFQIFAMDSNTYSYQHGIGYDYVHEDQIEWYKSAIDYVSNVPSFVFQHIPLIQFVDATKEYQDDPSIGTGENHEKNSPAKYDAGFWKAICEKQSTKAVIVGHDHVNYSNIEYTDPDTSYQCNFIYGIKSTDNIYHEDTLLGGRVFNIKEDGTWTTNTVLATYGEDA